MLYGQSKKVIVLPLAVFASFIAVAIMMNLLPLSTQFHGPLALPDVEPLATAFYSLSAGLNVLTTGFIATKLFRSDFSASYISIIVLMVESAVLYTACSVTFVLLDRSSSSAAKTWFAALVTCMAVSHVHPPMMLGSHIVTIQFLNQGWIILRVTMARSIPRSLTRSATVHHDTIDLPDRSAHHGSRLTWAAPNAEADKYAPRTELVYTVSNVSDT
jgi:hypothetical protein